MPKILHLTDCETGGVPAVIDTILDHIPGYVAFVGRTANQFRHQEEVIANLKSERTKNPIKAFRNLATLVSQLEKLDFSLIHAHSSFGGVYGAALSLRLKLPLIYSPHATPAMIQKKSLSDWVVSKAEIFTCIQSTAVIACSEDEQSAIKSLHSKTRTIVIPNGIKLEKPVTTTLDWDLLAVGRICSQKRPDLFLTLTSAIREEIPNLRVAWVGPGLYTSSDPALSKEAKKVDWLGEVSEAEVNRLLATTRVFVSTSDYEGLSLASIKAAASGCFLLLRDAPGTRAPVQMGAAGLLFKTPEAAAAAAIPMIKTSSSTFLESATSRTAIGQEIFGVERQIRQLGDLYAQFVCQKND